MLRILIVAILSFASFFPLLILCSQVLGVSSLVGWWIAALGGWLICPAVLLATWRAKPDIQTMAIAMSDPIMLQHIAKAREELPRFLAGLQAGKLEAFIKFPYEFSGAIEHVWGVAHVQQDQQIVVSLASTPVGDSPEALQARIAIAIDAIEDWMLVDSQGATQGGYTLLATLLIYQRDHGTVPRKYVQQIAGFVDFSYPPKPTLSQS